MSSRGGRGSADLTVTVRELGPGIHQGRSLPPWAYFELPGEIGARNEKEGQREETIVMCSSSGSLCLDPRVGETVNAEVFSCKDREQSAS